jgi:hypothetical protein
VLTGRLLLAVAILMAPSCVHRQDAPLALHADVVYPSPGQETCRKGDTTTSTITVIIQDEMAAALSGVPLYLGTMSGQPQALSARTDERGAATLVAPHEGAYVLTAAAPGFTPEVRALTLKAGCEGRLHVKLKIWPGVVER